MILEFEYQDADGAITLRRVDNYVANETHFVGFDLDAAGERTFRRINVRRWIHGSPSDLDQALGLEFFKRGPAGIGKINTAFTGFNKSDRATLESAAEAAGHIVRTSVTGALTYLCVGPNAGPSKLERARTQGVAIVTRSEFETILANSKTGKDR